jgi:hypothetical protein
MAEREGFEPSIRFNPYNRLAGDRLRPTRPPLPTELTLLLYTIKSTKVKPQFRAKLELLFVNQFS